VYGINLMDVIPMPASLSPLKITSSLMAHLEKMRTLEEEIPSFCVLEGKRIIIVHDAAERLRRETDSKLAAGRDRILLLDRDRQQLREDFQAKSELLDVARSLEISDCDDLREEYLQFVDPLQARFNVLFAAPLPNSANRRRLSPKPWTCWGFFSPSSTWASQSRVQGFVSFI
jgi:hypothetical protein